MDRRGFIKGAAGTLAGVVAAGIDGKEESPPTQEMPKGTPMLCLEGSNDQNFNEVGYSQKVAVELPTKYRFMRVCITMDEFGS